MVKSFAKHLHLHDAVKTIVPQGVQNNFAVLLRHVAVDLGCAEPKFLVERANLARVINRTGGGDYLVMKTEHLQMIAEIMGFPEDLPSSQYQNLLLKTKRDDPTTRKWSEPKFMAYLYKVYVRAELGGERSITKPKIRKHRRVDFEEMQKQKSEIGRIAEDYALDWGKKTASGGQARTPNRQN